MLHIFHHASPLSGERTLASNYQKRIELKDELCSTVWLNFLTSWKSCFKPLLPQLLDFRRLWKGNYLVSIVIVFITITSCIVHIFTHIHIFNHFSRTSNIIWGMKLIDEAFFKSRFCAYWSSKTQAMLVKF